MAYYGFVVTDAGRDLIARLMTGDTFRITRVMVGSGAVADGITRAELDAMTDLVTPVAQATSTAARYEHGVVSMVIEYRTDLNGGLSTGFWLREFGVFADDLNGGEVMVYYGTLGSYPQWCSAYTGEGIDVRRFPISIMIGEDLSVQVDYNSEAWMTETDVLSLYESTLKPMIREEIASMISAHNDSPESHPDIRSNVNDLLSRISMVELILRTNVNGVQFSYSFGSLDGIAAVGTWNEDAARIEF